MQGQARINETEQKISDLERENFDLKMRLYYLNNEKKYETQLEDETDKVINILSQRDLTYEQLRSANEEAHNRINELQSELLLLKTKQDTNNQSYESLLLKNQRLGSLQLEENLKRERQAAQAIAKHDAILISNYEKEIERLKDTHHADTLLISECSERVSELMKIVEDKNKELQRQHQSLIAAQQHVEVLTDRIAKQEILLIKNEQSHKTNAIASLSRAINPNPPPPPPPPPPTSNHYNTWSHADQGSPLMMSSHHGYHANQQDELKRDLREPNLSTFQPAPKLGTPFFASEGIDSPPRINSRSTNPSHFTSSKFDESPKHHHHPQHPQHHHNLPPVGSHHLNQSFPLRKDQLPKDNFPPHSSSYNSSNNHSIDSQPRTSSSHSHSHRDIPNSSMGSTQDDEIFSTNKPKSVLYRELESCKLELKTLTEENKILKDTLEKNKILIENQEKTLERVRASAEEITLLEAEEIARLEVELERMKEEKDKWMNTANRHEAQLELLKQELYQRERNDEMKSCERPYDSNSSEKILENPSSTSPIFKYRLSSSFTPSSSTQRTHTNNSKSHNHQFAKSWNSSLKVPESNHLSNPESPVIEMYRQREVELLEALEGVVKRCHELEAQLLRSK